MGCSDVFRYINVVKIETMEKICKEGDTHACCCQFEDAGKGQTILLSAITVLCPTQAYIIDKQGKDICLIIMRSEKY